MYAHFEVHEKTFGLWLQQSLSCTACHYKSRMYKLHSEVEKGIPGQNPCAPNVAIHVGLQDTTIGNKHEVVTHSGDNKHASPKLNWDTNHIQPGG